MMTAKTVEACTPWQVTETTHLYDLVIKEGAQLIPPEGKFLTLTVNGYGRPIAPGSYHGDVVVSVTSPYSMAPHGLHLNFAEMLSHGAPLGPELNTPMKQAAVVTSNKVVEENCVPAILQDGKVDGNETDGVYLASTEEDFCGFIVDGTGNYTIKNSRFDLEADGHDDWLGKGTAITAIDDTNVVVDNCQFNFSGVTRCTVQAGGRAKLTVKNSKMINLAPDGEDWVDTFSWQVGFRGHTRLAQLCDNAEVRYENCVMHANGWGLLSIDGSGAGVVREGDPQWPEGMEDPGYAVTMYVKDSDLTLTGPRSHGYGAFCIGDNHITFDHTKVDVFGYPILLMGMQQKGRFDVVNGSLITGRRFGALVVDDENSVLNIEDSTFKTGKSSLCVKGSSTRIDVKNSQMIAGNGTILQLMDCDEGGMNKEDFKIPMFEKDEKDADRDLTVVSPTEDVTLNLTDCQISGNFYNSTTNIRAYQRSTVGGMGKLHDRVLGIIPQPPVGAPSPTQMRHNGNDLKGAMNLGVNLVNTTVTGVISAAGQKYREGLAVITPKNRDELSDVTQFAAQPVNNGVVVTLDAASKWVVTGQSFLTSLTLAEGAQLSAQAGKTLTMTVNGTATPVAPGTYTGVIELNAI
jgi:hypothetical protein